MNLGLPGPDRANFMQKLRFHLILMFILLFDSLNIIFNIILAGTILNKLIYFTH